MKDWFKARNSWGAAFLALSDAEAGRLAKALWQYTMEQKQPNLSGAEKASFAIFQLQLAEDEKDMSDLSEKRRAAGSRGGKQTQAKHSKQDFACSDEANQANADNKNKNKNKNDDDVEEENAGARAWMTEEDVQTALDRDSAIEQAARSVGLQVTEAGMLRGRALADQYGLEALLDAIAKSIDAPRWAYVEGVLRNGNGNGTARPDNRGADRCGPQNGSGSRGKESAYAYLRDGIITG